MGELFFDFPSRLSQFIPKLFKEKSNHEPRVIQVKKKQQQQQSHLLHLEGLVQLALALLLQKHLFMMNDDDL